MNKAMRTVVAAMGFVLMGMTSITVAGDMMGDKETMMDDKMTEHKGMEEAPMKDTMDSKMEGRSMMQEEKADSMKEEMDKGKGMAGEMKETM